MEKILKKYKSCSPIVKASIWFLICSFIQKAISFISTPIFTRLLTTNEYGKFNVFCSWEYIINIFVSLCLSAGVYQQGLVKYEDDRDEYSSSMQGLTFILVSLWTIIYIIFRNEINKFIGFDTKYMLSMIFIIWTNNVFAFWANEQKVQYKYKKLIFITLCASVLNPILGIGLINIFNDKVFGRILASVIVSIVLYTGLFFSQVKKGKKFYKKDYWKNALAYNIPLIPHYLSQTLLSTSDKIMIEKIVNLSSSGIYSLAYSISLIMTLFNTSLMQTISPWMYKQIKNKKIEKLSKIAYLSLLLIAVANLLLIALAPEVVMIFAPKQYYEAIYVIPPIALSVYFMYAYDLFAKFEFYYEKTKLIAISTFISALTNIVLNFIFIKKFGYIAAGYTTLICYILYAVFHYIAMIKVCNEKLEKKYPYDLKILLLISIIFLCLGFIFMFLYKYIFIRYGLLVLFALIILINNKKILYILKKSNLLN